MSICHSVPLTLSEGTRRRSRGALNFSRWTFFDPPSHLASCNAPGSWWVLLLLLLMGYEDTSIMHKLSLLNAESLEVHPNLSFGISSIIRFQLHEMLLEGIQGETGREGRVSNFFVK